MSTIQELFQQAQLAEAAYANLRDSAGNIITDVIGAKTALKAEGFSEPQATEFLKQWRVVDQSPPLGFFGNGFSATLFERLDANQQPTGQYTLSIAGSVSPIDFANDLLDLNSGGVAYFQVQSMINYVLRLQAGSTGTTRQVELLTGATAPSLTSTFVSGIGPGITPSQLTITGHSLGGFLGQVYQRIFGSAGVYTYNALGLVRQNAPVFDQLTSLLGLPAGSYSSGPGENLLVPGEPAQLIGTVQGKPQIQIFTETESATINPIDTIPAHKVGPVTNSLVLYDLFAMLDPSLNTANPADGIDMITAILKAASADPSLSLEATLDKLRTLILGPYSAGTVPEDRDSLYANIGELQTALATQPARTIVTLASLSRDQMAALAQTDIAYRYALVNLAPFALTGDDSLYAQHNTNGELDLYDPATGQGALTDLYLQDRAAMLDWVMQFNTEDIPPAATPFGDTFFKLGSFGDRYYFEDETTHTQIRLGETVDLLQPPTDFRHIAFGSDAGETLTGDAKPDHLYGMGGDDILIGNNGSDHLEGGQGYDTYVINSGDGLDTVLDSDGSGVVVLDGIQAQGKASVAEAGNWVQLDANTWQDNEHDLTYQLITQADGTQDLYLMGGDEGTRIKNWHGGDLGIDLGPGGTAPTPIYGLTLTGDLAPIDFDPVNPGVQPNTDALDNVITDPDMAEPGRADALYDSTGNDKLLGLAGDDILYAWRGGDDRLEGGTGNDIIDAGPGDDIATGNAGQDLIWGGTGADRLYAQDEQALDTALLAGETQAGSGLKGDLLDGGDDNDSLVGDDGNDTLAGGAGSDLLLGGGGDDNLMGDDALSNANLDWSFTRNIVTDANGTEYQRIYYNVNATESANGGADVLYGGAGNDWLFGQNGNDVLDGGTGDDVLLGGADADVLLGQGGNDVLIGDDSSLPANRHGDDYLDGGDGNDQLWGGGGSDQLMGGAGDDILWGQGGDDTLDGGAGQDWLMGDDLGVPGTQHGADTLQGGSGDDYLFGQGGDDILRGGQGNDYLQGDDGGLAGEFHGNDTLYGDEGDDTLIGDGGNDILNGGEGNDTLIGDNASNQPLAAEYQGNDTLLGGAGSDQLLGGGGNDMLIGGTGLDYLDGGSGDDVYRFELGDSPLISGTAEGVNDTDGVNRIEFGAGISAANANILQFGQDMALNYSGTDWLWIYGGFNGAIQDFHFADGQDLNWMQLIGQALHNPVIISTTDSGAVMVGGAANDTLSATGGGGTFSGGQGNDTLSGAGGNNIYLYSLGDGTDHVVDTGGLVDADGNPLPNVLRFGDGITAADLSLGLGSLVIRVGTDPNDTIHIGNFNPNDVYGQRAIDWFEFSDGTALSYEELLSKGFDLGGTAGNDVISGTNIADRIEGGEGNDTLNGGYGDDTYLFDLGDGVDTINEAPDIGSTDVLKFGPGIDPADITIIGDGQNLELIHANGSDKVIINNWFANSNSYYKLEQVEFADGTQWTQSQLTAMIVNLTGTAGDDTIDGSDRDETLNGLAGNDTLNGGNGNDTYLFDLGGGVDTINEIDGNAFLDVLKFGSGITPADITFVRNGDNLEFLHANGNDKVIVANWFVPNHDSFQIDSVEFTDGTQWTKTQINALFETITGTAEDDTLYGSGLDETLYGLDGNDTLDGSYGNDTLIGGNGNDTLMGGAGVDIYLFDLGDGVDTIFEEPDHNYSYYNYYSQGWLRFGAGINPDDISVERNGTNLEFSHANGSDKVIVNNWFYYNPQPWGFNYFYQLDGVEFADGTQWTRLQLTTIGLTLTGTVGDDTLYGSGYDETLHGLAGNDVLGGSTGNDTLFGDAGDDILSGGGGDDTLSGGDGNDILYDGGWGNDTYLFDLGGGMDTINVDYGQGYTDVLKFGVGINPNDITVSFNGNNLELSHSNGIDKVIVANWFLGSTGYYQLDRVEFADGTQWTQSQLNTMVLTITGSAGDDTLSGSDRDEILDGLPGNDTLNGGLGNDTYLFDQGGGVDIINEYDSDFSTDVIKFGESINTGDITVSRVGDNLEFHHANGSDKVIVANWFLSTNGLYFNQLDWVEFDDGTKWSAATISQMLSNATPTGYVTLNGTAAQGQELTVTNTLEDADGLGTISYQWQASTNGAPWSNIAGATAASFTLTESQVGQQVRAVARYTDGHGTEEAVTSEATVAVANVNDAPIASAALANQTATQGLAYSFTLPANAFTDPDLAHGDVLNYGATKADGSALPGWLIFNPDTKTFSGTPANEDVGAISLKVTATDQAGLNAMQILNLAVANVNDAPALSAPLDDQQAHAGTAFTYQVPATAFVDIDEGDFLTYNAALANGAALPTWLSFNADTRTFSGTPSAADAGQFDVKVLATDSGGLAAIDVFTLAIDSVAITGTVGNDTLSGSVSNDTLLGLDGNDFLDGGAGADTLVGGMGDDTYVVDDVGDMVTENTDEGTDTVQSGITYTLGANVENLTLTGTAAIDGTGNEFSNILTGNSANNTLTGGVGSDTLMGGAGADVYVFNLGDGIDTIIDDGTVDSNRIVFGLGIMPNDVAYSFDGNTLVLSYGPLGDELRLPNFDLAGLNGSSVASTLQFDNGAVLTLVELLGSASGGENTAPTVGEAINPMLVEEDAAFHFVVPTQTFVDPDSGDELVIAATLSDGTTLPAWLDYDAATQTFSGTPGNGDVGMLDVRLTATDMQGASVSTVFNLSVLNVNDAPELAVPLADQTGRTDTVFSYQVPAGAFTDVDPGDSLSYAAVLADGLPLPDWLDFDAVSRTFIGTPPVSATGVLDIRVTATDESGSLAEDSFRLVVTPVIVRGARITGTNGNDNLAGTAGDDIINGLGGNDIIAGGDGNDVIMGGDGNDTLIGNGGDDTFLVTGQNSDFAYTTYDGGDGFDTVLGTAGDDILRVRSLSLANGIERIDGGGGTNVLAGTVDNNLIDIRGIELVNIARIDGGRGNDTLIGDDGANILVGGDGNDTLIGNGGDDTFLVTGQNSDFAYTTYDGGDGFDTVLGTAGDDILRVRSLSLANGIERIDGGGGTNVLAGTVDNNLIDIRGIELVNIARIDGGRGNDTLIGDDGANILVGGDGNDTLIGNGGDDTFLVTGQNSDFAYTTYDGGDGFDTVLGTAGDDILRVRSLSLANGIERIDGGGGTNVLAGTVDNNLIDIRGIELVNIARIDGGRGNDTLIGDDGANILVGGDGNDTLIGNGGDDTFLVTGQNSDFAYTTYDGGDGFDTVLGTAGDDILRVRSLSLANGIERIDGGGGTNVLAGTVDNNLIDIRGIELVNIARIDGGRGNDTLIGDDGANILVGGDGNDTLIGNGGDDTFLVTGQNSDFAYTTYDGGDGFDTVLGTAGDDILRVRSLSLANGIERIDGGGGTNVLAGTVDNNLIDIRGIELVNIARIDGGRGNDTLIGDDGANILDGGAGADTLVGGTGNDTYLFNRGDGADKWTDTDATVGNVDIACFGADIAYDQIWFQQIGNDLEALVIGTGDKILIKDWYSGSENHLELFEAGDGKMLLDSQVQALVDAMAAFAPPTAGQTTLPTNYQDALAPVLAGNWH